MSAEQRPESPTALDRGPPANFTKWEANTNDALTRARKRLSTMLNEVMNNEAAEAASKSAAQENAAREKQIIKDRVHNKVKAHSDIIATSYKCMTDIETATQRVEDMISRLTHQRYAGFASLQVAEKRMKLREKRPPAERFRDRLAEALVSEQSKLLSARQELVGLTEEGKKLILDLESKRCHLSKDTGERRLEIMMLEKEAMGTAPPAPAAREANAAPAAGDALPADPAGSASLAAASAAKAPAGEGTGASAPSDQAAPAPGAKSKVDSKALIDATVKLLERAADLEDKGERAIHRIKGETKRANDWTEECLAKRTLDLAEIKKKIEGEIVRVEGGIESAERSLKRSEGRLDPKDESKKSKLQKDRAMLEMLGQSRKELQADLRTKFAALEIDNMCRRITPAKAAEQKKQVKKTMVKTASAPNLKDHVTSLPSLTADAESTRASTANVGKAPNSPLSSSFGSEGPKQSTVDKA